MNVSTCAPLMNKRGQTVVKQIVIIVFVTLGTALLALSLGKESTKSLETLAANLITHSPNMVAKPVATSEKKALQPTQPLTELFVPGSKEYEENWCSLEELTPEGGIIAIKEAYDFEKAQ